MTLRPRHTQHRGRCATGEDTTFDQALFADGIELSLIGLGVVFFVFVLLVVAVRVLDRIESITSESGKSEPARPQPRAAATEAPPAAVPVTPAPSDDARTAAAIGVALALAEAGAGVSRVARTPFVAASRAIGNAWVTAGRSREMANRNAGPPVRTRARR